jgi:hypothetical protein
MGRAGDSGTPGHPWGQGHAADPPQHRSLLSGRARGHSGRRSRGGKERPWGPAAFARGTAPPTPRQSPDSRIVAPPSLPRASAPVACLGFTPRSQWRDRAGLSPASLFRPRQDADPTDGHLRDTSRNSVPSRSPGQPAAGIGTKRRRLCDRRGLSCIRSGRASKRGDWTKMKTTCPIPPIVSRRRTETGSIA